ncbi:MAG: DODA-type extradiol aromatic ring-opening family dioxygenase [Dehalococcoidia bacterium]
MARIVGAMSASHAPSIPTLDRDATPQTRGLFDGFTVLGEHLAALRPDALVMVYDDHVDNFFFNAFPTFSIGVGESFAPADEGRGAPNARPLPGHSALARAIAAHLVEEGGFDMTVCEELRADHGAFVPTIVIPGLRDVPIVPIVVNTVQEPMPSARRCWQLGQALAVALAAAPGDERVALIGTGGLAHQLGGPRFGWIAEEFDRRFLQLITSGPREALTELTNQEIAAAGNGTNEIRNWIVVAGAVPDAPARVIYYEPLGITGTGIVLYDMAAD